jgi:hypothetical protein
MNREKIARLNLEGTAKRGPDSPKNGFIPRKTPRKTWFWGASIFVLLSVFFAGTSNVWAEKFETPQNRNASEILRPELVSGPHYRILNKVVSYGYMHHYTVDSDFGVFKANGDYALRKLLKEIRAIEALREVKKSRAYGDSVKEAAKKPVYLGKDLITEPVDTISGIPKGVHRLFGNIYTSATETKDPSEDARYKQALTMSAYKRDRAYELGVDVYSSNPVLQEDLNSVGWAGALGNLSVTALTLPAQATAIKVAKGMRLSKQMNEILKEEPPARLRQINEKKLASMGVATFLANQFLDHPHFTPRHDTVIVECLARLSYARGRAEFIHSILGAQDEETANFFQNMAETMRGYHEEVSPIKEINIVGGLTVAGAGNGSALIPFPLDHGVWTEKADRIIRNLVTSYRASGLGGRLSLWVTGTLSPMARKNLTELGIEVAENVDQRIEFMD